MLKVNERKHLGNTTYIADNHSKSTEPRQCNKYDVNRYKKHRIEQTLISGKIGVSPLNVSDHFSNIIFLLKYAKCIGSVQTFARSMFLSNKLDRRCGPTFYGTLVGSMIGNYPHTSYWC